MVHVLESRAPSARRDCGRHLVDGVDAVAAASFGLHTACIVMDRKTAEISVFAGLIGCVRSCADRERGGRSMTCEMLNRLIMAILGGRGGVLVEPQSYPVEVIRLTPSCVPFTFRQLEERPSWGQLQTTVVIVTGHVVCPVRLDRRAAVVLRCNPCHRCGPFRCPTHHFEPQTVILADHRIRGIDHPGRVRVWRRRVG